MKKCLLLFVVLISFQLVGQQTTFKGSLLDAKTKEPVVYANISFIQTSKGISTTEQGTFFMYINQKYLKGKVHISCLNYKDTLVNASDLNNTTLSGTSADLNFAYELNPVGWYSYKIVVQHCLCCQKKMYWMRL